MAGFCLGPKVYHHRVPARSSRHTRASARHIYIRVDINALTGDFVLVTRINNHRVIPRSKVREIEGAAGIRNNLQFTGLIRLKLDDDRALSSSPRRKEDVTLNSVNTAGAGGRSAASLGIHSGRQEKHA